MIYVSAPVDLTQLNTVMLETEEGFMFSPREFGIIITQANGLTVQPTVSIGDEAGSADLVSAIQTTTLGAVGSCQTFTSLSNANAHNILTLTVTVGATATILMGIFYCRGILIVNPNGAVASPYFSVVPGTYNTSQTVALGSSTVGANIFYTLDGTTPTALSTPYTSPITINSTTTISVLATLIGWTDSISIGIFTIILITSVTPSFGPATGGTNVLILGSGFTPVTSVMFGRTPAASFSVDSDTQISCVTPAEMAGTQEVLCQ